MTAPLDKLNPVGKQPHVSSHHEPAIQHFNPPAPASTTAATSDRHQTSDFAFSTTFKTIKESDMVSVPSRSPRVTTEEDRSLSPRCASHQTQDHPRTLTATPLLAVRGNKMRRMRFSIAWDVLLLKLVTAVDLHLALHVQSQKRFEEAVPIFVSSLPSPALEETGIPSWKTLTDRFKKIVAGHRAAVKANVVASGIIEVRGEREILLDDIVLAIDEWEESRRAERDERTELDKRLQVAGEAIRARALSRERTTATPREGKDKPKMQPAHTHKGAGNRGDERKRAMSYDSDDEARCTLSEHMSEQRNVDHKRLKMEELKLESEISRDERARERLKAAKDHEASRIAVEEKRMELEERRLEIEREERRFPIQ